jgi:hypothetical protein
VGAREGWGKVLGGGRIRIIFDKYILILLMGVMQVAKSKGTRSHRPIFSESETHAASVTR